MPRRRQGQTRDVEAGALLPTLVRAGRVAGWSGHDAEADVCRDFGEIRRRARPARGSARPGGRALPSSPPGWAGGVQEVLAQMPTPADAPTSAYEVTGAPGAEVGAKRKPPASGPVLVCPLRVALQLAPTTTTTGPARP